MKYHHFSTEPLCLIEFSLTVDFNLKIIIEKENLRRYATVRITFITANKKKKQMVQDHL